MPAATAAALGQQTELVELVDVLSKAGKKAPPAPRVEALEKFAAVIGQVRSCTACRATLAPPDPAATTRAAMLAASWVKAARARALQRSRCPTRGPCPPAAKPHV